jgi:hypothetical protein
MNRIKSFSPTISLTIFRLFEVIKYHLSQTITGKMSVDKENFYSALYEWDTLKTVYLVSHSLLSIFCPILLLCIIWYEKNSADLRYRSLINQLLSHLCFILLFVNLFARPLAVATLFLGPFSQPSCDVIVWIG